MNNQNPAQNKEGALSTAWHTLEAEVQSIFGGNPPSPDRLYEVLTRLWDAGYERGHVDGQSHQGMRDARVRSLERWADDVAKAEREMTT